MFEYTCPVCGKVRQVSHLHRVRTFCSKSCAAKHKASTMVRTVVERGECIYQPESITCDIRQCDRCGWNPEVAKARLEKFLEDCDERITM